MQYGPMFLAPVDILGCISFNITVITTTETNDFHMWSCVCCYQFLALCDKHLFKVIIFASLVNFTVCATFCNLDSQITYSTEDFPASRNWDGLPHGV